jgi:hypothetical protein
MFKFFGYFYCITCVFWSAHGGLALPIMGEWATQLAEFDLCTFVASATASSDMTMELAECLGEVRVGESNLGGWFHFIPETQFRPFSFYLA